MTKKILKATHAGVLEIGEIKIPCYVLEDGARVISQTGVAGALGLRKTAQIGAFVATNALNPFINKDLTDSVKNPIFFTPPKGRLTVYGSQLKKLFGK